MTLLSDVMPMVASMGVSASVANNKFAKNADVLSRWRAQVLTVKQLGDAFDYMMEMGSLKNCGGVSGVADKVGCTLEQAQTIVNEVIAGFDAYNSTGPLE